MKALDKSLRNELARTVLAARKLAEEAAGKALHTLGVDESDAPGHLDNDGRRLRIRLRAQARQLGDRDDRQKQGCYEIRHLIEKIAYDHWHRLLFARFLAENDLLISPDHGVGISLDYCGDLAPEMGFRDGWEVAANFAARMLPQIFRPDDPAGNVVFAPEDRVALRKLVTTLPRDILLADDSLGWVYQFWQAQRKDDVNKSGEKIGADEIAPVTQLFTDDYMVLFLLHNTLGAWWAAKVLAAIPAETSAKADEASLRQACVLPGVNWEYLRFIKDDKTGAWRPAAGNFAGWPKTARELRLLDPCMGSGHFVVAELPILVAMRMTEEGLSVADAVEAVLRDNLFGLEIDPRCTQIAAFNLALAAWKLTRQYRQLPPLNIACCGLGINARMEDWLKLTGDNTRLRGGMEQLFDLFQKAPDLGSLINPRRVSGDLLVAEFHKLQPLLEQALAREESKRDEALAEMGVTARGLAHAAEILVSQFTLVATNVPYLTRGKQNDVLKEFCERHHPNAKADLATSFVERSLALCADGGSSALVTPQNWLFLNSYSSFRTALLKEITVDVVAKLGANAFELVNGWVVNISLSVLTKKDTHKGHSLCGIDVGSEAITADKARCLIGNALSALSQEAQLRNPDAVIAVVELKEGTLLRTFADSSHGQGTFDSPRFSVLFWEVPALSGGWVAQQSTPDATHHFGGCYYALRWENGAGQLADMMADKGKQGYSSGKWKAGVSQWGKMGVIVGQMGDMPCSLYMGSAFDENASVIIPSERSHLAALWCFCVSDEFRQSLRTIDQSLKITCKTLVKVPFDLAHWQQAAADRYPHGLPKPHSDDPTQWLFNGHPKASTAPLQVVVTRLLGYRWPRQTGSAFPDCPALGLDGLESFADADGIVCINAIKGEQPAAERLRALLAAAFGRDWSATKQTELLAEAGYAGKTLEEWLRNGFFEQHCQLFHQHPFIWQVWDGLRDGFSVLVNYHRLDRRVLEKLIYVYLGDWIARQKAAVAAEEEGSDAKLTAAQELKVALENILRGEAPYDIFVRWKPLEKQPVGWEPDINDGVRLNIRPFVEAGILRRTPKINWKKDRGKDVPSAPWYKVFKGDRINDHHLTLAEKREKGKEA